MRKYEEKKKVCSHVGNTMWLRSNSCMDIMLYWDLSLVDKFALQCEWGWKLSRVNFFTINII